MFQVYILRSLSTGRYYVGHTNDLPHRLHQHNSGYSISTKSGIPWKLVYSEQFQKRSEAMIREREIKRQKSRSAIARIIEGR